MYLSFSPKIHIFAYAIFTEQVIALLVWKNVDIKWLAIIKMQANLGVLSFLYPAEDKYPIELLSNHINW